MKDILENISAKAVVSNKLLRLSESAYSVCVYNSRKLLKLSDVIVCSYAISLHNDGFSSCLKFEII